MHHLTPPAPPPVPAKIIKDIQKDLAWIEGYVCTTFFFLMAVYIIGIIRRRCRHTLLQFFAWVTYSLLIFMIPYILGLIRYYYFFGGKFMAFLWAVLLLFGYGSVDNFNAVDLDDRGKGKVFFFINLLNVLILLLGFVVFYGMMRVVEVVPLLLVLAFAEVKVVERTIGLMYSTCNTPSLNSFSLLNGEHDPSDDSWNPVNPVNPIPECRYLVSTTTTTTTTSSDGGLVTVNKIWCCEDRFNILSDHLKDCCLSFSLFWKLLRRFVRFEAYEASHPDEAWRLVRQGLLAEQGGFERPFRVIEAELSFLYDFFYSKYFCFYQFGLLWQLKHVLFLGVVGWIVGLYLTTQYEDRYQFKIKDLSVDNLVTKIVITVIILVEITQLVIFMTSRWAKVMILCLYVRRQSWMKRSITDCFITKVARIICGIRLHESFTTWRNELSQYSLLESYDYLQCIPVKILNAANLVTGVFVPRVGRKESKGVKVTDVIKKAVIVSLQGDGRERHGRGLNSGIASLEASRLDKLVDRTKKLKLKTDIHVILVWHIATTLCEADDNYNCDDFEVATCLSKYCAYLVAFDVELLPGESARTDTICSQAIEDAKAKLKDIKKSGRMRREKLKDIAAHLTLMGDDKEEQKDSIVSQAVKLRKELGEIGGWEKRWQVLAEFWAEMVLYLAPNSTNYIAHAQKLADGGEFITHLWALLFHAGIVDRSSFTSENASSDHSAASYGHSSV